MPSPSAGPFRTPLRAFALASVALSLTATAAQAAPQDVDLLTDTGSITRVDGPSSPAYLGYAMSTAGDFNGDGVDDVIAGAPVNSGTPNNIGSAYVVYGRRGADPADLDLATAGAESADRFMRIGGAGGNTGISVSGGEDLNGDGLVDLVVGAANASVGGTAGSGRAYIVYGQAGADPADLDLASATPDTDRFRRIDGVPSSQLGASAASAGDLNNDGLNDVVLGALGDRSGADQTGAVYVVYGAAGDAPDLELAATDDATRARFARIGGQAAGDIFGAAVAAAGDVNGDGRDDIVVGARSTDYSALDAGSAYVIYGQEAADAADLDLASTDDAQTARYRRIDGESERDQMGYSVAGDVDLNGDGRDDIAIGANQEDSNDREGSGSVYVVYGQAAADPADYAIDSTDATTTARYTRIDGPSSPAQTGYSSAGAGDINGDGLDDLAIGAPTAVSNGRAPQNGAAFVVFGQAGSDPADLDLASTADGDLARRMRIDGAAASDVIGAVVDGAGDVNGDGRDDVVVGGFAANKNGRTQSGSVYLVSYDGDDDGVADASEDNDADGTRDPIDNCPTVGNAEQTDTDADGAGNACDSDDDGDGTPDASDALPLTKGEQVDTDGDGVGNNADTDDDGDGVADSADAFPLDKAESADKDGDGIGDNADTVDNRPKPDVKPDAKPAPAPAVTPRVTPAAPFVPAAPPLFVKSAAPAVALRNGRVRLATGLKIVCPAGGPACTARVSIKTLRRNARTGRLVKVYLTRKGSTLTLAPGTERPINRLLTASATRMLKRAGSLNVVVRSILRVGGNAPIVREEKLRLVSPPARR